MNLRNVMKEVYGKVSKKTGIKKPAKINMDRMNSGNSKLDSGIMIFDLLSGVSCGRHCQGCYAYKAEYMYPAVKYFRNVNMMLAESYLDELKELLVMQINREYPKMIRIHSAGDFLNQDYINMWTSIIKEFPEIKFYTYSKRVNEFDFSEIKARKNFNLINSLVMINGQECFNYGNKEYVELLQSKGYFLCPVTNNENISCGKECKECFTRKKVCFLKY
jgi:hypothetical protein